METATAKCARIAVKNTSAVFDSPGDPSDGYLFLTDFRAVASYEKSIHDHRTGRKCAVCGGVLYDTIINFGEDLPAKDLKRARSNAQKADLCLALGSSLTVTPANGIPETVGKSKRGKLVICNLQKTPLDHLADLRIHTTTDDMMVRLMDKLRISIPTFILRRILLIRLEKTSDSRGQLSVSGVDTQGTPMSFLRSIKLKNNRRVAISEPFLISLRNGIDGLSQLDLEMEFMGHYAEPPLEIIHNCNSPDDFEAAYLLEYDPHKVRWQTTRQDGDMYRFGDWVN